MSTRKSNAKNPAGKVMPIAPNNGIEEPKTPKVDTPNPEDGKEPEPSNQDMKTPKAFIMTKDQLEEIAECINSVVGNKYTKQTIFNCINGNVKPVI